MDDKTVTMLTSDIEPMVKRQKMSEKKPLLKDLPSNIFSTKLNLFEDPKVTIIVQEREFKLPKALICYYSSFFEKAFSGEFREGKEQKLTMTGCTISIFEMLVQWLYTSSIVISPLEGEQAEVVEEELDTPTKTNAKQALAKREAQTIAFSEQITRLLAFLRLTDEIDLIGPFDIVAEQIRNILKISRKSLTPKHVRSAAELPKNHFLRTLFAQACFPEYVLDGLINKIDPGKFRFAKELLEIEAFAADLSKELILAFPKRTLKNMGGKSGNNSYRHFLPDPLTGGPFKVEF